LRLASWSPLGSFLSRTNGWTQLLELVLVRSQPCSNGACSITERLVTWRAAHWVGSREFGHPICSLPSIAGPVRARAGDMRQGKWGRELGLDRLSRASVTVRGDRFGPAPPRLTVGVVASGPRPRWASPCGSMNVGLQWPEPCSLGSLQPANAALSLQSGDVLRRPGMFNPATNKGKLDSSGRRCSRCRRLGSGVARASPPPLVATSVAARTPRVHCAVVDKDAFGPDSRAGSGQSHSVVLGVDAPLLSWRATREG